MSYRNPKQVIDRRSSIVNNAVGQMLATISKDQQTFALAKKKEKAAQQLVLDKATASARSGYDQSFQNAQAAGNKFTSQLTGEDGKVTKDAISFNTQIQTHLSAIGEELNTKIEEIQKDGGTTEQIQQAKNAAIMKMNKFTVDMQNWEAARQEYMLAIKENPDDWHQDNDVLDTWFSSALWPLTTLNWPSKNGLFDKYFCGNDSHVFLPIITEFCSFFFIVLTVISLKCLKSDFIDFHGNLLFNPIPLFFDIATIILKVLFMIR